MSDELDLTEAKKEVARLNNLLNCVDYELQIDNREEFHSTRDAMGEDSDAFLTLYVKRMLKMPIAYIGFKREYKIFIYFDSYTDPSFRNKRINTLLRAALILTVSKIPGIKEVKSSPHNPISGHLMKKYFNATGWNVLTVILSSENIDQAQAVFDEIVENFDCEKKNLAPTILISHIPESGRRPTSRRTKSSPNTNVPTVMVRRSMTRKNRPMTRSLRRTRFRSGGKGVRKGFLKSCKQNLPNTRHTRKRITGKR